MTSAVRNRTVLQTMAAVLAPVGLVLSLVAVDEPTASALWTRAGEAVSGGVEAFRAWTGEAAEPKPAAETGSTDVLAGAYRAADAAAADRTGDVHFVRAELRFEALGVLKTRPLRIGYGREIAAAGGDTFAGLTGGAAGDQIELREVLGGSTAALCGQSPPGVVGLRQAGDRVTLIALRDGPLSGASPSPEAVCAVLTYRR